MLRTPTAATRRSIGSVTSDAGLMMDRARCLRANNYRPAAQQLAARAHNFVYRPADPERFYDMLILLADDAAQDRNWQTAYQHREPDRRCASAGSERRRPTDRDPRQLHEPRLARRKRRARPDEPARRTRSRCSTAMRAPAARSRCRPRAITGRAARRLPPGSSKRRTPISSRPRLTPNCSTASWRSSGLAVRFRRRRRPCRNM